MKRRDQGCRVKRLLMGFLWRNHMCYHHECHEYHKFPYGFLTPSGENISILIDILEILTFEIEF